MSRASVAWKLARQLFSEHLAQRKAQRLFHSIRKGNCACNGDCFLITSLTTHWKFPFLMLQQRLKRLAAKAV